MKRLRRAAGVFFAINAVVLLTAAKQEPNTTQAVVGLMQMLLAMWFLSGDRE